MNISSIVCQFCGEQIPLVITDVDQDELTKISDGLTYAHMCEYSIHALRGAEEKRVAKIETLISMDSAVVGKDGIAVRSVNVGKAAHFLRELERRLERIESTNFEVPWASGPCQCAEMQLPAGVVYVDNMTDEFRHARVKCQPFKTHA